MRPYINTFPNSTEINFNIQNHNKRNDPKRRLFHTDKIKNVWKGNLHEWQTLEKLRFFYIGIGYILDIEYIQLENVTVVYIKTRAEAHLALDLSWYKRIRILKINSKRYQNTTFRNFYYGWRYATCPQWRANTQIKYILFPGKKRLKIAEFSDYVLSPSLQYGVEKQWTRYPARKVNGMESSSQTPEWWHSRPKKQKSWWKNYFIVGLFRIRLWIRILLFSSVAFKMPKKKVFISSWLTVGTFT